MFRSTASLRPSQSAGGFAPFGIALVMSKSKSMSLLLLALISTGCSTMSGGATDAENAAMASKAAVETTVQEVVQDVAQDVKDSTKAAAAAAAAKISFANGEANWIITEGLSRNGRHITFKEARIDGNGWLVLHPFKDGKPNGAIHVGASYLRDGVNRDITIAVTQDAEPKPGEMFLVMLHSDVNEDQVFDFVFVDERNVLDKAVFEGMTMIAHVFPAP